MKTKVKKEGKGKQAGSFREGNGWEKHLGGGWV